MAADDLDDAVALAVSGDERAFTALYRAVQPSLLRYLTVTAPRIAEDVASETWAAVVPRLPDFRGGGKQFRSWVFTIARSKVIDRVRQEVRRPVRLTEDLEALGLTDPQDVARVVIDDLSTASALALVRTLPPEQSEVITLRVLGGLDTAEVARITGKSVGAVRVAQHRGLKRLAAALQQARLGSATELDLIAAVAQDQRFVPDARGKPRSAGH